jgi:drug/metabolite transporter (DMT)-like permease
MSGLNIIDNFVIAEARQRQTIMNELVPIAKVSLFGIFLLVTSTLANSIALPMCKFMHIQCASIKMVWRCIWYFLFMIPTFIMDMVNSKPKLKEIYSATSIFTLAKVGVLIFMIIILQIVSVKFTYASHTTLFGGMPAVILIISKLVRCILPKKNEMIGALVAIVGSALMMLDSSGSNFTAKSIMIGDSLAILSSMVYAFFMVYVGPVLQSYPLSIFITISGVFTTLSAVIYMATGLDGAVIMSFDPQIGFLSVFSDKYNFLCTLFGVGLCGAYLANITFYAAFKYFSPLVISLTLLAIPFVTELVVIILGIEGIPGYKTMIGGVSVLIGLMFIARADGDKE